MFITFEGGEGCGKSTQVQSLKRSIEIKLKKSVVITREPGGTLLAEKLREIVLEESGVSDPIAEFLIINAARYDHVYNFIKPQLNEGKIVISDRFFDSSIVYQGLIKGMNIELIQRITDLSLNHFSPQATFLLDIDPIITQQRIKSSNRSTNHYDLKDISFHQQVRDGFLKLACDNRDRFHIIDADQSIKDLSDQIYSIFKDLNHKL